MDIMRDMMTASMMLDTAGAYDLSDRMERLSQDMEDTSYMPPEDPDSGPSHEETFMRWYPIYRDAMKKTRMLSGIRQRIVSHLQNNPGDMQARVQLHAIDEALRNQGAQVAKADIPDDVNAPNFDEIARRLPTTLEGQGDDPPMDMRDLFSGGMKWGTSAAFAITEKPKIEKYGFADIKRVTIGIATAGDANSIVPIARQMIYQYLQEHGVDDPGDAVNFRPNVQTGKQMMFADTNESSQTFGKKKRGYNYSVSFEFVDPAERHVNFDGSRGETWSDIARRSRGDVG